MFLVFFRVNELKYDWSLLDGEPLVDIAIIRSNSIVYDPRIRKIVRSLGKKYSLVTLGWHRESGKIGEIGSDFHRLRLFGLKAPFGKPTLAIYMPLFWIWIFYQLIIYRPKVVHACDLDTVLPCYIYKIFFRKKLVFDVFDRYAMGYIPKSSLLLSFLFNSLEELMASRSDVLITVSDKLLETFRKKPKCCLLILNCQEEKESKRYQSNSELRLVYTGPIQPGRGIERIAEVIKTIDGIEFILAGRIIDKGLFDSITSLPNVKYSGLLKPDDAIELEASSDVIISLYDLRNLNYKYAMPNKTFAAMAFGLPLITNVAPELVDETKCGIKVDYNDSNQIKAAIISLRDNNELRKTLGANGRKAFEQKYNWGKMEEQLFSIYERLQK